MAIAINFITINVNSLNRNASIAVGENNQPAWMTHGKAIFGNCQVIGISFTANIVSNVIDCDLIDSPIFDQDFTPAVQNQQA